jgi:LPS-assembly lipoprotein
MSFVCKRLFILLNVCLLVSCGFHLRGLTELSPEITPIFIEQAGIDNALNRELRTLLSASGKNNLTQTKSEARVVLSIVSTDRKRRVVAVDDRGRARQYELSYIVRYSVSGKNIPQAGNDNINVLHLKREVIFDPDRVLAIGHEVDTLYNVMRKDSARLILQRLRALNLRMMGEQFQE